MSSTRRAFLHALAAGSAALGVGWAGGEPLQAAERAALDAARRKASQRRRRIIYNNDGDDIWAKGADTAEKFLAFRHAPLLKTHVDSIYYCTTQSFNLFTHDTKTAEVFLSREGQFADNNLPKFLQKKTDALRLSANFARKHGLESVWTLRMNDIHDAWTPQFVSQWKKTDPRRIMSTLDKAKGFNDRRRLWSLVDFEHPDVEPRLLAILEEVLRNYPVDGVELDWMRAPFYFRSHYEGGTVTDKQVEVLTRLTRNIRKLVLRESERQGKPFLLAARVPVTLKLCRRIGIDIAGWLAGGLVDVLTLGGGYVVFDQPIEELIALAHKHQVPAYPCISQSGMGYRPPRSKGEPQPVEAWHAAALRFWEAGADGIYTFNLFPGPGTEAERQYAVRVLKTIGSRETLRKAGRAFAISDAGAWMPPAFWAKDAEDFAGALPVPLSAKEATSVTLVAAGRTEGFRAELRLDFTGLAEGTVPNVTFEGRRLAKPEKTEAVAGVRRFRFAVPADAVKAGKNAIGIQPTAGKAQLAGAELWLLRDR
ncbi:MAG: hypothetical protein HYS12_17490 [Planctomycetes bacterium]|nr:hypothetical protein [Planctomycetota bacterium]